MISWKFCCIASVHELGKTVSLLKAMHNKFPLTFIYSINKYLLKVFHVPAPSLGMEIIRTSFCKVYVLVVEADNKKRKQIKGILLKHNVAVGDIK